MQSEVQIAMAQARQAQQMYRPKDLLEGRMAVQSTAQIKEVTRRTVTPKNGNPPFLLYEIEDSNGTKWTTKKDDLALTAHALVGKSATIEGSIVENGRFKNYYLNGIWESNGVPAPETAIVPTVIPDSTPSFRDTTDDKDISIWRQVATKVAAQMSEGPDEFWKNVEILMTFYATGQHPDTEGEYATAASQATHFTGDDDIPF